MKSLMFLLFISVAMNGLLAGFLAGHLSDGHRHCTCCKCDVKKPLAPRSCDEDEQGSQPSIEELKGMKGWVR